MEVIIQSLVTSKIVTENAAIEREAKRKAVELEHYNKGKVEANKILKEMKDKGFTSKSQPSYKSLDANDTVSFDDVMSMFAEEQVTSAPVVSNTKISTETADFFTEKYTKKHDTEISINSLPTSRRRFQPRVGISSRANVTEADYGYSEI